jgi:hypothetical protein
MSNGPGIQLQKHHGSLNKTSLEQWKSYKSIRNAINSENDFEEYATAINILNIY